MIWSIRHSPISRDFGTVPISPSPPSSPRDRRLLTPPGNKPSAGPWFRTGLAACLVIVAAVVALAWLLPIEYFQALALERAGQDAYRQFEAVGRAEAAGWVVRCLGPVLLLLGIGAWRRSAEIVERFQAAGRGFLRATQLENRSSTKRPWATTVYRGLLAGWLLVAAGQWCAALNQRLTDWPYYRFRSGPDMLPNISDSNRDVIRYLRESTPPDAKILVASDQKLFFLSYYLLPRRIYHRVHPDSEFVIPQPNQERRLAAYRLEDLDPEWIRELKPDYLLEYFEHPDSIDRTRVMDDPRWVEFLRQTHRDPKRIPNYIVRLQPMAREPSP